jgi:Flp pilus assembly protein TadD
MVTPRIADPRVAEGQRERRMSAQALPGKSDGDRYEAAARVLERASQAAGGDANVQYLLFLAHKRQGKINDARNALRKIAKPDADVVLQMALLSLEENNLAQAEGELVRARGLDPSSYEIAYNLLLTQLTLGKVDACLELIPQTITLIEQRLAARVSLDDDRRFLQVLGALLRTCKKNDGRPDPLLAELHHNDESRLLQVVRSLGQLDTVHTLLKALSEARPRSAPVREAYIEAVLVKGKELIDRCQWTEAELLLRPVARERGFGKTSQVALLNLLGCCAAMTQDYDSAVTHFSQALKLAPDDPRLHQNLALTYELEGSLQQADPHWNRYFDLLGDRVAAPPDMERYPELLQYESLHRLAARYGEKEKWANAIGYMQRAAQVRPDEPEALERLFQMYNQAKRTADARRTLEQLRRTRPGEPQYELYELDLIEVKGLNDIEKLLTEIERIRRRYPDDQRVDERAVSMAHNVIPLMGNLCDQLTEQMSKVIDQVRSLPNYQINWSAVREVMRDLIKEFQKLRRITGKCLPLVTSDEDKRIVRDLADHIDKKMEACRSMGA